MFSFFMASKTFSFGSLFTPMSANGLSFNLATSDRSWGYIARQGPHQWPQKSRTTTLPR